MKIVTADIGGTHARFAVAEVDGRAVAALHEPVTLATADYDGIRTAWRAFAKTQTSPLPRAAAIALAAPLREDVIRFTNSDWSVRPDAVGDTLGLDRHVLLKRFRGDRPCGRRSRRHLLHRNLRPGRAFTESRVISVIGPGTGLGVAAVLRADGHSDVMVSEGSHGDFAPLDELDDHILARLRKVHDRVSVERVVSGPGLRAIYETLAERDGAAISNQDDRALWAAALDGGDPLAPLPSCDSASVSVRQPGISQLTFGPGPAVIAGGLSARLAKLLPESGFAERFVAKGRYRAIMETVPVKLITHPEPGLYGAAKAFAKTYSQTDREYCFAAFCRDTMAALLAKRCGHQ